MLAIFYSPLSAIPPLSLIPALSDLTACALQVTVNTQCSFLGSLTLMQRHAFSNTVWC